MIYEKSFSTFIDIVKGVSIGYFVAFLVGIILQHNESSWTLLYFGTILAIISILFSIIFDRIKYRTERNNNG